MLSILLMLMLGVLTSATMELTPVRVQQDNDDEVSFSKHTLRRGSRDLGKRIVGGDTADPTLFPYFSLLNIKTDAGRYQCGGTLISPDIVMSAAHCYQDFIEEGTEILGIRVWVNRTTSEYRTGYEYARNVVEALVHPNYNFKLTRRDIVLLKLNEALPYVPTPRTSTSSSDPAPGTDVIAIGHGMLGENDGVSIDLQAVDLNVIDYDNCNDENSYRGAVQESSMVCAGVEGGGKDSCGGDSGGPLILKGGSPRDDIIVGITSWGTGCARDEKFGVYSKVSAFEHFIKEGTCVLSPTYCNGNAPTDPINIPATPQPPTLSPSGQAIAFPVRPVAPTKAPIPATRIPTPEPTTVAPSTAPTGAPLQSLNFPVSPSVAPTDECVLAGDDCESDLDCCDLRCVDISYLGKRCFGPRGAVKQSSLRYGASQGGSGSGRSSPTTWLLRAPQD